MGRPMPAAIRATFQAAHHPARGIGCPRCAALVDRPCRSPKRVQMDEPHPSRIAAWSILLASCTACQVQPGVPCHLGGRPFTDHVHTERIAEARHAHDVIEARKDAS